MKKNREILKALSKSKEESYPDLRKMREDRDFRVLKEKKLEHKQKMLKEKEILKEKMMEEKKVKDQIDQFNNRSDLEELSDSDDGFL